MPVSDRANYDWWVVATTVVLAIAVTLVVFSTLPEMASNDLTAQMTPEVTKPPMRSQQGSPVVPLGEQTARIGVGESNSGKVQRFGVE